MTTCEHCGRDIVRVVVGGIDGWGHATNPGPNHHPAKPALTVRDRFWAKVDQDAPNGCWEWTGVKDRDGYGDIRHLNTEHRSAHRFAYTELMGRIPDGMTLDHLCRNHACVHPGHLEPVTNRENILRGTSPAAGNARKSHCPSGHPLSGDNLLALSRGGRSCKACHAEQMKARGSKRAEYMREFRARRKAASA